MLGAPRPGPYPRQSPMSKIFSCRWLVGGLVSISPRDRVALQHAHLRSGVRLIARNRRGRRDQSGAPMAVVPEGYRAALGASLLDGVRVIFGAELDLHLPRVRALLPYLAFEALIV